MEKEISWKWEFPINTPQRNIEQIYVNELARGEITYNSKLDYAHCLVESQERENLLIGMKILEGLLFNCDKKKEFECLFARAYGHYRLKDYHTALEEIENVLKIKPNNTETNRLYRMIKKKVGIGHSSEAPEDAFVPSAPSLDLMDRVVPSAPPLDLMDQLTGYEMTSYDSKIVVLKNDKLPSPRQTADEGEPGPRKKEERSPEDEITKERLENLEKRISEMEEATNCPICFVRRKNIIFKCGHGPLQQLELNVGPETL